MCIVRRAHYHELLLNLRIFAPCSLRWSDCCNVELLLLGCAGDALVALLLQCFPSHVELKTTLDFYFQVSQSRSVVLVLGQSESTRRPGSRSVKRRRIVVVLHVGQSETTRHSGSRSVRDDVSFWLQVSQRRRVILALGQSETTHRSGSRSVRVDVSF